ncbi:uncharacterized protein A4U43_C04F22500 [Asparagus officinalis]|uniref:Uncharacterized protein n=1 Tax=Asparagus officinalis TaxID=4686 RepID=A0A5P1F2X0_ASPOF|nr:uncharacterized protein A4U43_C04F22500 [Asparagus officinalis]
MTVSNILFTSVEFLPKAFNAHAVEGHCYEAYASTDEPIPVLTAPVPTAPQFAPGAPEELPQLIWKGECHTLRKLITDVPLVKDLSSTHLLRKLDYLFGDSVEDPATASLETKQWLHHDDGGNLYLPPIPHHRSLTELRCQAVPWECRGAIRTTTYGLTINVPHFLALLELYNPDTNTFLTKYGILPFLPGAAAAEVANAQPLQYFLESHPPLLYSPGRNLDSSSGEAIYELMPLTPLEVNELINKSNAQSYTTARVEGDFAAGTKFQTFLWQTLKPIRPMMLLAGYLAIWLKKCVVSYQSADVLPLEVLYPTVLLTHQKNLSLLTVMTTDIHRGLCQIVSAFTQGEGKPSAQIPLTKVELPYTYLMAWFILHCSDMMSSPTSTNPSVPFLRFIENCKMERMKVRGD